LLLEIRLGKWERVVQGSRIEPCKEVKGPVFCGIKCSIEFLARGLEGLEGLGA